MGNIHVKLFEILTRGSGGDAVQEMHVRNLGNGHHANATYL